MRSQSIALIALLLAACSTPMTPEEERQKAADICKVYRGYLPDRDYGYVLETCSRQLGEAYCRQCLAQPR
jgi:hypothetical protein